MVLGWTPDLNTGIEVIDDQHRRLIECINALEVVMASRNRAAIGEVLDRLVKNLLSHFTFEEALQVESGYKFAAPHKAMHAVFAKRVMTYRQRFKDGENVITELHSMLCTWLVHHIQRDDGSYIREMKTTLQRIVSGKQPGGWLARTVGRHLR